MNEKQREKFWKHAGEYDGPIPYYRFHDEWYYMVTDGAYRVMEEYTLHSALSLFHALTDGENCAVYLYRGSEHLATYNGGQTEPEGETTYHVTKSALAEWLDALSAE